VFFSVTTFAQELLRKRNNAVGDHPQNQSGANNPELNRYRANARAAAWLCTDTDRDTWLPARYQADTPPSEDTPTEHSQATVKYLALHSARLNHSPF
jgi:hypothetical protein